MKKFNTKYRNKFNYVTKYQDTGVLDSVGKVLRKRRFFRSYSHFLAKAFVYITRTKNNTFITVTTKNGDVLVKESAGGIPMPGPKKKKSGNAAERCAFKVGKDSLFKGYNRCYLRLIGGYRGPVKSAVRGLTRTSMRFTQMQQITREAHNGVRIRKSKRK
jgi:ribosomal protein S11